MYVGGFERNFPNLSTSTKSFTGTDGKEHPYQPWPPSADGLRISYMAKAFPRSRFRGFDTHAASIDEARRLAFAEGVADRVAFDVAGAVDYDGADFGVITFFDCLHDLGDPVAAARQAAGALAPGGTLMVVEPFANDRVADNLSPVARLYYAASTVVCCAHAISEGGALVLGAQAGEARLTEVFRKAGLTHVRRAAQTAFNLILEVRH